MIAKRMEGIHSVIRGPLYEQSLKMAAQGIDVLRLNSGNLALFGFKMPESVKSALLNNVEKATGYCDFRGMPDARKAIAEYHLSKGITDAAAENVFIGNGVSELAETLMLALIDSGDEVLLPCPTYSLWSNSVIVAGGKPVYYMLDEGQNWFPDIEDIKRKITNRTKAIVLINPHNPTGVLYPKEVLVEICRVARENGLVVISDEIYDRLVFEGKIHVSTASVSGGATVVTMNGLSKSHIVCGLRSGWMIVSGEKGAAEIKDAVSRLMSVRICGNTVSQLIVPAALKDTESTAALVKKGGRLYEQSKAVTKIIKESGVMTCVENDAAFYVFPRFDHKAMGLKSDNDFCAGLLKEKHILVIPGSGFMYPDDDHLRIVMLPEKPALETAMTDLIAYARSLLS